MAAIENDSSPAAARPRRGENVNNCGNYGDQFWGLGSKPLEFFRHVRGYATELLDRIEAVELDTECRAKAD